jgi:predicted aminopeptidase
MVGVSGRAYLRVPRWVHRRAAVPLALATLLLGGCQSLGAVGEAVGYYGQAVGGHLQLMRAARPVDDWLADPATPPALAGRLREAQQMRRWAVQALALPDNASYTRYAQLDRPAVVWNVVATPELSLALHTWCHPLMGCVGYQGWFDEARARAEAARLQARGLEVMVYGVPAYSTLGWTNWLGGDPLLDTFVRGAEDETARLIFHELAHQRVYVADDTRFNESYATAVERLGLARWQADQGRPVVDSTRSARLRADFLRLTRQAREELQALYARQDLSAAERRQQKAEVFARLRAAHAALKAGPWQGDARYDAWFARANNAALALQTAYDGWVPAFERLHAEEGADFARFHAAVERLAALPPDERRARLQALMAPVQPFTTRP